MTARADRRARPRLPRQIPPTRIEQDYAAALIRMTARVRAAWAPLLVALPAILDEATAERAGARSDSASSRARALIRQARAAPVIDVRALEGVAKKFASQTSAHQKEQLARQARAAIKVDPVFKDANLAPMARHFVHENVALVKRIPARLHDDLEVLVHGAVSRGRLHKHLKRDIEKRFKVAEKHARLIARDQIGKFHAKVNHHRQKELGVKKFTWRSVGDERVRDWHRDELDGNEYRYDDPPDSEDGEPILPGEDYQCFPGSTRVSSQSPVTKLYRRWYRGKSAILHTDDGRSIESTPNHPLLTSRGWVASQDVQIGDYVVKARPERFEILVQDRECRDASLSELFNALAPFGPVQPRRSLHRGFHGDASLDQKVDVVELDWSLPLELDTQLTQPFSKQLLVLADNTASRLGDPALCLGGLGHTPRGVVRRARKLGALLGAGASHSLEHRLAAIAWLDSVANELRSNGCARNAEVLRDALDRPAAVNVQGLDLVTRVVARVVCRAIKTRPSHLDAPSAERLAEVVRVDPEALASVLHGHGLYEFRRVVEKRVGELAVHVYNLETDSGWYTASGTVVHNCRCSAEPVFED